MNIGFTKTLETGNGNEAIRIIITTDDSGRINNASIEIGELIEGEFCKEEIRSINSAERLHTVLGDAIRIVKGKLLDAYLELDEDFIGGEGS